MFIELLLPSWLSGLAAVATGVLAAGTAVLLRNGSDSVQQGLLGLRHAYIYSSVGASVRTATHSFAQNEYLNDVLTVLLWGAAGLVVYAILQGILNEVGKAKSLLRELHYVHADRRGIVRNIALRATIRLLALAGWWLLFRYLILGVVPYTVAVAHTSGQHPADVGGWVRTVAAVIGCMLGVHVSVVLLRLSVLRVRLFGDNIGE